MRESSRWELLIENDDAPRGAIDQGHKYETARRPGPEQNGLVRAAQEPIGRDALHYPESESVHLGLQAAETRCRKELEAKHRCPEAIEQ